MPALVVPAEATIKTGVQPLARSASIAASSAALAMRPAPSVATSRAAERPMPASCAILTQLRWHSFEV